MIALRVCVCWYAFIFIVSVCDCVCGRSTVCLGICFFPYGCQFCSFASVFPCVVQTELCVRVRAPEGILCRNNCPACGKCFIFCMTLTLASSGHTQTHPKF